MNFSTASMTRTICCNCGIEYEVPDTWLNSKRETGQDFYCPNGHLLTYGDTEMKKLKRQLQEAQERERIARTETIGERQRAERAERKLRRNHRGVCTDCNRSFTNLRRHMETKHGAKP